MTNNVTDLVPLTAPVLSVGTPTADTIPLTWTDPDDSPDNEVNFQIQVSTDGGTNFSNLTAPAQDATSDSHTGLPASTTRHYRIKKVGNGTTRSDSAWSNVVSGTTAGSSASLLFHLSPESLITEDGNGVSQWNDESGNNNHFTQSNNSYKPVSQASVLNGFRGINFNILKTLTAAISSNNNNYATFIVVSIPSATRKNVLLGALDDTGGGTTSANNTEQFLYTRNATDIKGLYNGDNSASESQNFSDDISGSSYAGLIEIIKKDTTLDVYWNGVKYVDAAPLTMNSSITLFGIGSRINEAGVPTIDSLDGFIMEVKHHEGVMGDSERLTESSGLRTKYAL